jgi:hypothetical protein
LNAPPTKASNAPRVRPASISHRPEPGLFSSPYR